MSRLGAAGSVLIGAEACCSPVAGVPLTVEQATRFADLLKVVAEPSRLRLISTMGSMPDVAACGCQLTESLGLSQPTVSHHMAVLLRAGIIEPLSERAEDDRARPGSTCTYYRLVPDALSAVARALTSPSEIGA